MAAWGVYSVFMVLDGLPLSYISQAVVANQWLGVYHGMGMCERRVGL